ncbi:MAG: response regulator [bacterium]|nr:response regulator [bacterium]
MYSLLLVGKEEQSRELLVDELRNEGYNVFHAVNNDEAIKLAENNVYDFIITEVEIKDIDEMKQLGGLLPGGQQSSNGYSSHFITWASNGYLIKSSNWNELKKNIRDFSVR